MNGLLIRLNLHDADDRSKGLLGHNSHFVCDVGQNLGSQVRRSGLVVGEERGVDVSDGTLGDYVVRGIMVKENIYILETPIHGL